MEIEEAVLGGSKVSGAVIDLVKAFNVLTRQPIFAATKHYSKCIVSSKIKEALDPLWGHAQDSLKETL